MVSPQSAQDLIRRCQRRRSARGGGGLPLPFYLAAGVLLGLLLANPQWLHLPRAVGYAALLAGVLWIVIAARQGVRRQVRILRQWTRATEAVQLEQWSTARQALCTLLSHPVDNSVLRAQGLLGLAAVADHYHEYRSSQLIYEHVLGQPGAQPVQLHTAAVGLADAMLRNDELTGAVQLIDRLARSTQGGPRPWQAHVELVRLFRELVMGQYDDLLEAAAERQVLFRECLSTRSGYGYALLALGYHRRDQPDRAARLWKDATLLVRPEKLLDRFPMLSELAGRYPAWEAAI